MGVAFLIAIILGRFIEKTITDNAVHGLQPKSGKKLGKQTLTNMLSTDAKHEPRSSSWIGDSRWPACKDECNFLELCLTNEIDPENKIYPHCEDYPMMTLPQADCLKCMEETGFQIPDGVTLEAPTPKCESRNVQCVITTVATDACEIGNKGTPKCDLAHPDAGIWETNESTCSCDDEAEVENLGEILDDHPIEELVALTEQARESATEEVPPANKL